jgi:exosortase
MARGIEKKIWMAPSVFQAIFLGGAFFFAFFPVFIDLWNAWSRSDDYSHGFFIIPIALFITWQKKEQLANLSINPLTSAGFYLPLLLLLYVFAQYAEVTTLSSLLMVLILFFLVLFLAGWAHVKALLFPLTLLFFMIPIPEQIYSSLTNPLQLFVSHLSVLLANVVGVPIYREGNVIHLPNHTFEVVQACSGLRSLVSLFTLSVVMGYFLLKDNWLRGILLFLTFPVAILVNGIRVFILIVAFYFFQYDLADDSVHSFYGLAVFMLALFILFGLRKVLATWDS